MAEQEQVTENDISQVNEQTKDFLRAICKNGLPSGNVFEFAAQQILKYEKKHKSDQMKKKVLQDQLNLIEKEEEEKKKKKEAEEKRKQVYEEKLKHKEDDVKKQDSKDKKQEQSKEKKLDESKENKQEKSKTEAKNGKTNPKKK
ncbi:hypothetical protein PPERSA_02721 [Pseudocohnilembus persalinus]|uniref:Uncharacterized protein n=1 Tax=Pseudocohnilembus persalinus TaxID=266149 RepID=A0A0V0R5U9_PSEPJ|nr:hypothetical protein PPERSA_02721 [Pseudocohnilembus persalinus]|eukprot:KRX09849.1 hypothetical protein PPERSA_02721 [Pseudocohnilembus persalinus]